MKRSFGCCWRRIGEGDRCPGGGGLEASYTLNFTAKSNPL